MNARAALAAVALAAAACGGKPAPGPSAPTGGGGQGVDDAVARVCATPMRAAADHEWGDPKSDPAVIDKHLRDGVTNARVLGVLDRWKPDYGNADRMRDLDVLIHEGGLSSPCKLRDRYAAGDSE